MVWGWTVGEGFLAIDVKVVNPHVDRGSLWNEVSQGVAAQKGRIQKWEAKVVPAQDPPVKVRDALKRVGGTLRPAVLEIHGAMDNQFKELINQICQRAKVFRGYSVSYFRRFCYETLGHALFKGQYDRCLNKATMDGGNMDGDGVDDVTCTDDLGVTVSRKEAATNHEQDISSLARTQLIAGRRTFRAGQRSSEVAAFFVNNFSGNPGRWPPGGSGRSQWDRALGEDSRSARPIGTLGTSHSAVPSHQGGG